MTRKTAITLITTMLLVALASSSASARQPPSSTTSNALRDTLSSLDRTTESHILHDGIVEAPFHATVAGTLIIEWVGVSNRRARTQILFGERSYRQGQTGSFVLHLTALGRHWLIYNVEEPITGRARFIPDDHTQTVQLSEKVTLHESLPEFPCPGGLVRNEGEGGENVLCVRLVGGPTMDLLVNTLYSYELELTTEESYLKARVFHFGFPYGTNEFNRAVNTPTQLVAGLSSRYVFQLDWTCVGAYKSGLFVRPIGEASLGRGFWGVTPGYFVDVSFAPGQPTCSRAQEVSEVHGDK